MERFSGLWDLHDRALWSPSGAWKVVGTWFPDSVISAVAHFEHTPDISKPLLFIHDETCEIGQAYYPCIRAVKEKHTAIKPDIMSITG